MSPQPTSPSAPSRGRSRSRRAVLAGLALAATMLVAACGSDDDSSAEAQPSPSSTAESGEPSSTSSPASTVATSDPYTLRVGVISANGKWTGPEGYSYLHGELSEILAETGVTELEVSAFPNGPNLNQALQAGQLDIGLYGDTPALVGKAAGLDTRVLVQSSVGIDAWIVTAPDGPTSLAELEGGSVTVAQGSYMDRYLRGLLAEEGLEGKVTSVNIVPPPDQKAALDRGDVQAIAATATNAIILRDQGYRILDKASVDRPNLRGTSVTVITGAALEAHPDLPAAWRAAHAQAIEEINAAPDEFNAFSAEAQGIDLAIATEINVRSGGRFAQYPAGSLTDEGRDLVEGTATFLFDAGLAKERVSIDDWFLPES